MMYDGFGSFVTLCSVNGNNTIASFYLGHVGCPERAQRVVRWDVLGTQWDMNEPLDVFGILPTYYERN